MARSAILKDGLLNMDIVTVVAQAGNFLSDRSAASVASEFSIGGVYFPPLMVASVFGVAAATVTAILLNRFRLVRFFYYPPLIYVALVVLYTGLVSNLFLPV
jgi:hypothetical protein